MHKNDRNLRTLFGKGYFYTEDDDGNLKLVSLASLKPLMDRETETLARMEQARG